VQALRAAVADQLLVTRPGEDDYELRHALLAEVIEADLLPGERAQLHAACARSLTERPELADASPAVTAAEVAVHWDAAGEWAQALPARVRAGVAAERTRALAEADHHYQRALTLWERVPEPDEPAALGRVGLLAGQPRRPPSSLRSSGRSRCWSKPSTAWIGWWSLSGPPCCWPSSASTANWPDEKLMRWRPSRRPSGCLTGRRHRPNAPKCWLVMPGHWR
jgi:hypothetical protein